MVRRGVVLFGIMLVLALLPVQLAAQSPKPSSPQKSGEFRGTVDFCGPEGEEGIVVYIPGISFDVTLGPSGEFALYYVPVGTYTLKFKIPGRADFGIVEVVSSDNTVTNLGLIEICRDSDGDGFDEDVDCRDSNPNIRPGVAELCNGFDDNCDGFVDEGCDLCTDGDNDGFYAQAGCGSQPDCNDEKSEISPIASETCNGIDDNCNLQLDEGFDLTSDPNNCGACGNACSFGNASADCVSGECVEGDCFSGFADCDLSGENGCEVDTTSDAENCSACGYSCGDYENATTACINSVCNYACEPGWQDCGGGPGCESYWLTDVQNCGGCGNSCSYPRAQGICQHGTCSIGSCDPGWGNCDPNFSNGCETALNTVSNCGACGNKCGLLQTCSEGSCVP